MSQTVVAWSRLIRYVNSDGLIKYGEPILNDLDSHDITELAQACKLFVRVCDGVNAIEAVPTTRVEQVHKLLGPLAAQEVPIIRCIGLNYKTHSKSNIWSYSQTQLTCPSPRSGQASSNMSNHIHQTIPSSRRSQ